jgi:hypothetical protein
MQKTLSSNPNQKNHQIIEGPANANQTVEGKGDAFHFDKCRSGDLVPHRQPRESGSNLKEKMPQHPQVRVR